MTTYKGDRLRPLLKLITPPTRVACTSTLTTAESEVASYLAPYVQSVVTLKLISPGYVSAHTWPVPAQQAGNIIFGHVNDETFPFARASFDCVICWLTAHHFSNATTLIQEAARVLVPGGILALSGLVTSGELACPLH